MKKRHWLLAAGMVLAAGLGYLIQDWVRVTLVRPLAHILARISFTLGIYWRSQDQELIWGAVLLTAAVLAAATLRHLTGAEPSGGRRQMTPQGRVHDWLMQLDSLPEGTYYQWRFAQEIGNLVLGKKAQTSGESIEELKSRLERGEQFLPEDIQRFMEQAYQKKLHEYYRAHRGASGRNPLSQDAPERITAYLEIDLIREGGERA